MSRSRATPRPPEPDRFARLMVKALREAGKNCPIRYERERFRLIIENPGRRPTVWWLDNAYAEYCHAPPARRLTVTHPFVRQAAEGPPRVRREEGLPNLLPRVRPRIAYESYRLRYRLQQEEKGEHHESAAQRG